MEVPQRKKSGPKGISDAKHNEIVHLLLGRMPVKRIVRITGIKKTKVYEIARNPVPKPVPPEQTA